MSNTPDPATAPEHHRFHFLDGLRGLAAIVVVALHPPPEVRQGLTTYSGHLAVDFFFCLSGFVIAFSYEQRLRGSLSWGDFAVARLIRLYPMIFLGTVLGIVCVGLNRLSPNAIHMVLPLRLEIWHALLSFTLMPAVFLARAKDLLYPIDPPMWSLFFEVVANFVFAGMMRLRAGFNALLIPLWMLSLCLLEYERRRNGTFDLGYTVEGLAEGFARVAVSFLAGVLVCRLYRRLQLTRIEGVKGTLLGLALVSVFLRMLCDASRFNVPARTGMIEIGLLFPMIVFLGARVVLPPAVTRLCIVLGNISYPLYLIHDPLIWPLFCTSVRAYFATSRYAMPVDIAYIATLILIAGWVARSYDAPMRKRLQRAYRAFRERQVLPSAY
jgi:peptidoglycan/LPS O-acetylase OafA/YrhL